jgi:hypothetical protein
MEKGPEVEASDGGRGWSMFVDLVLLCSSPRSKPGISMLTSTTSL